MSICCAAEGENRPVRVPVFKDGFRCVALIFSRFPFLVLFLTLAISVLAAWAGIYTHGYPEFEDPYLGFETRRTPIANRLAALENLRTEFKNLDIIENFPGERLVSRESKRRRELNDNIDTNFCTKIPLEEYSRVAVEIKSGHSLFSFEVLQRICYFQKLLEDVVEYGYLCEKDNHRNCCPSWSLPNYIALHANKTDCTAISEKDALSFSSDLSECIGIYKKESEFQDGQQNSSHPTPEYCQRGSVIETALLHTIEASFMNSNVTRFSMIILPVPKNAHMPLILEELVNKINSITDLMQDDVVTLGGFDFGTKAELFRVLLITDLNYVLMASVVIFSIVCSYTKSFLVTAVSFGALTLSLGVSYFLYTTVFCIPYFPFMNMLVTIIVLGIGTDGTLIVSVAWRRCRANLRDEIFDKNLKLNVMEQTLKETTSTLFITTCTTACAFFATLRSSITTICCFSIFAGTTILVSFVLIFFTVPTALLASDILWLHFRSLIPRPDRNTFFSKLLTTFKKTKAMAYVIGTIICPININQMIKTFTTTKWAIGSFLIFVGIFIWGTIRVFYYPGFQLPTSEQFQLLSYDHPIEKYDREIEPQFNVALDQKEDNLTFYFVWGVKDIDNGASLNPSDDGFLEFDHNFTLADPENQRWIRKFCKRLRNQSFYDIVANTASEVRYDTCMLDTMISWMKRDCEEHISGLPSHEPCCKVSKFPYEPEVFSKCIGLASRDIYRTPAGFFRPDISGAKFFTTYASKDHNPAEHDEDLDEFDKPISVVKKRKPNYDRMGDLATFTVRVNTNITYSISYDKMSKVFHSVDKFFTEALKSAPASLQKGFFASAYFNFFDLQHSLLNDTWQSLLLSTGLCFVLIWVSSRSFFVSCGAVMTILATVVVSSAVLIEIFAWKLGVFESIAVTVAVGLSDFTAHHSIEFAKRKSIIEMTSPTFFSALTTIIMGLSMMIFSQVLVYQQIGSFFFVLVLTSWLYSVFFLTPLLLLFDMIPKLICVTVPHVFLACSQDSEKSWWEVCHVSSRKGTSLNEADLDLDPRKSCNCSKETCNCPSHESQDGAELDGEIESLPQKKQSLMMEKIKLLKKIAQETTV